MTLTLLHHLDLPNLRRKPSGTVLLLVLQSLDTNANSFGEYRTRNSRVVLDPSDLYWLAENCPTLRLIYPDLDESFRASFHDAAQIMPFLTSLVASSLDWIAEEDRELIWELSSTKMSDYNSGFRSDRTRVLRIGTLEVELFEPGFDFDHLGLKTWGSSHQLCNYLVNHFGGLELKEPVLELGSGTGLVGIVLAKLGMSLLCTDLPPIVENLRKNLDLNGVDRVKVSTLDWTDPEASSVEPHSMSTILVSDCIYSSSHPKLVSEMVARFLKNERDSRLLLQVPIRKGFVKERDEVWGLIERLGLRVLLEHVSNGKDDFGESEFNLRCYGWK
ncbi:unnamed protein product [Kuraishia capsulata CBS 1993]|uniref:Uncharacterized protein n=1 Tax=Kuraishia capsulata CBS 1993 TaxID=1382522 RepID=W6MPZ0_9ASCO|nr:uncharacterized protein KUCA_T00004380001 [Kuraishia capsulata CBS 1993]CDK28398.1 unnamed protein product [Kuraishia capsulata CBS 1993]